MTSKTVTLNPGESQEVVFQFTPTEAGLFNVRIGGLMGQLVVTADTRVSGRVVRSDNGSAVSGATVITAGGQDITDNNGWFHIDGVSPGNQILTISKDGFEPKEVQVELTQGANNNAGIIGLIPIVTVGSISGRMEEINPSGQGYNTLLTNFNFKIDGYDGKTDGEGFFTVSDLPLGHYSQITASGYIPISIDLDVIGDMDLGIVEMAPTDIQWEIVLSSILIDGALAEGNDITVSVKATLFLSELNKPVSRDVTLVVNDNAIATKTITLTRTSENFPATEEFELATINLTDAGTYLLEVDGLSKTIEVSALPNMVSSLPFNEISNYKKLIAEYDNCVENISWQCPVCNRVIVLGGCPIDDYYQPAFSHVRDHMLGYISPTITQDEAVAITGYGWKDYLIDDCKYKICATDNHAALNLCRELDINLTAFSMYYNGAEKPVYNAMFNTSNIQDEPHLWWEIDYAFIPKVDLPQMINALSTMRLPSEHGITGPGANSDINPEWAAINDVPCYEVPFGKSSYTQCGYEPPLLYKWGESILSIYSPLESAPNGEYYVLAIANYYEQGTGEGQTIPGFKAKFQKVWVVGEAIL